MREGRRGSREGGVEGEYSEGGRGEDFSDSIVTKHYHFTPSTEFITREPYPQIYFKNYLMEKIL